ncbi:hypothetical protein ASPACDRAFT_117135 [Aspergillus aculeatus ATCC 16872]|uniref:Uncharacterized protein n=1 Tax=Aspergillus aculeatus (strain ATCC 16872 / CBS 172.66 / WB 5094) TaxID=690307 RepID=A0A1L9WWY0_ASPA1|nr:uncharacterized protein ASPACDRAFT_117135 [Aspergillus aculeatus ATCC 16872]OJK00732.1 hypothetical protein ASPACDRAFT_117135 [Aspergillus aculeatus ATCC 16872]
MAEQITSIQLGREVERLVTAPYAPSLQDLYGLIQDASPASIRHWAFCKPCQVGALVDLLVEGLSRSRFALSLLNAFMPVVSFRDFLLQRYPYLLDQFLERSTTEEGFEYASLCIAILSSPLPPDFLVPARLTPFLSSVIRQLSENPCSETILPLHRISTGLRTSPRVLLEISTEIMSSIQVELTKTLRNLADHMGNLLSLATLANLASLQGRLSNQESRSSTPQWLQSVSHFFGPKRGLKTMDLVVLRVILACSDSCSELTPVQAAESICLAIQICDRVEPEQKAAWNAANPSKIAKLQEKVMRSGIDRGVQILGATFLVSILPKAALTPEIPRLALDWALSETSPVVLSVLPLEYMQRLAIANAACSEESAVRKILDYAFSTLQISRPSNPSDLQSLEIARSLVTGLQNADAKLFATCISETILRECSKSMSRPLESFPRAPSSTHCHESSICYDLHSQLQNELVCDLFACNLYASLSHKSDASGLYPAEVGTLRLFTEKSKQFLCRRRCTIPEIKPNDRVRIVSPLRSHGDLPSSRSNWREALTETLMLNSRTSQETMIRAIENICYDLEQRCGNVEAPLRAVERERDEYSLEAEKLREQNVELQSQLVKCSGTIDDLHQDFFRLEHQSEAASMRAEELTANLKALQKEFADHRRESQETVTCEREQARTRELDLVASITEKDDLLEALQEEVTKQKQAYDDLRNVLAEVSKDKATCLEQVASLEQEAAGVRQSLQHFQTLVVDKEEEAKRILDEKQNTGREAEILQERLHERNAEFDKLQEALQTAIEEHRRERANFEERTRKAAVENDKWKEKYARVCASKDKAAIIAATEAKEKNKRIEYLETKMRKLKDERAAKAREFSEAQQHIGRLMNIMGFKAEPEVSMTPKKHRRPRSNSRAESAEPVAMPQQTQVEVEEEDFQTQPDERSGASFESEMSSSRNHSQKRSLDRAFPNADLSSPRTVNSGQLVNAGGRDAAALKQHRQRTPLADADPNSQPSSQQSTRSHRSESVRHPVDQSQPRGVLGENHLQHIDLDMDLEFSKDFLFTSTSLSNSNDHAPPSET